MKKILLSILSLSVFLQLNAQEKPEMFDFLSKFKRNTSIEEFKSEFSNSLHERNELIKSMNDQGIFFMNLFAFDGRPVVQLVYVDNNTGGVTLVAIPDLEKLDSLSQSKVNSDFKKYVMSNLGEPDEIDDNIQENMSFLSMFVSGEIKRGHRFMWENHSGEAEYAGFSIVTEQDELFIFMVLPSPGSQEDDVRIANVPLQRKFFGNFELGKYVSKNLIVTSLGVREFQVKETKVSGGKTYEVFSDIYFGGHKWSIIEINSVEGYLSKITFTSTESNDNKYIYNDLLRKLTEKYGEPYTYGETIKGWLDKSTILSLSYVYGKSNGGEWRHYVFLSYHDGKLVNEGEAKATDEL